MGSNKVSLDDLVILYKNQVFQTTLKYRNGRAWDFEKHIRLKHLLSFCKIKRKERHNLIDMIDSPDEKNFIVAESIILTKLNAIVGRFIIEEDAAKAYDTAAKIHHKEFANLNFK